MHTLTKLISSDLDNGKSDNGAHSGAHRTASDQPVIIPDWIDPAEFSGNAHRAIFKLQSAPAPWNAGG